MREIKFGDRVTVKACLFRVFESPESFVRVWKRSERYKEKPREGLLIGKRSLYNGKVKYKQFLLRRKQ